MTREKKFYYFRKAVLLNAILIGTAFLLCLGVTAFTYNGQCDNPGFMGGPHHPCSFFGALGDTLFALLLVGFVYLWWVIIPVLILLPVIALLTDLAKYRSSRISPRK